MRSRSQLQSYYQTLRELCPRQREVMDALLRSAHGLSAWEIADLTGRLVHAVRPRLTELRKLGIVRESGTRWEVRTQRHEVVWQVTPFEDDGQMRMAI